jgi:two-component system response regulator RstA
MTKLSAGKHILIVEDDDNLAALISKYLARNGYQVAAVSNGDMAYEQIAQNPPQLVVLDIMLPGIDGYTLCRRIRQHYRGPVLMLTARGEEVDEITGFESGTDDYLRKPVRPAVLLARIEALLRRVEQTRSAQSLPPGENPDRITCGRLEIDRKQRLAVYDCKPLRLTSGEFDLLWYLASHRGYPLSREQLFAEMRGFTYDGMDRSIDLRISKLRKKLGDVSNDPRIIKSVRSVCYLFVDCP